MNSDLLNRLNVKLRKSIWNRPILNKIMFTLENITNSSDDLVQNEVDQSCEPTYYLSAMVRVKNEELFILEWVRHHELLGFQHFYVYDNGSTDRTREVLRPLIDNGLVTLTDWPQSPISPSAEFDFFKRFANQSEWVAFFDSDEFLDPGTRDIIQVLERHSTPALAVNWRYYGSSQHSELPDGLLTEHFTWCDAKPSRTVKVIARIREISGYRNPHNFWYRSKRLATTADGIKAFGTFADIPKHQDPSVVLRHFVHRGAADYERKTRPSHSATRGHQLRGREQQHSFEKHNEIELPFTSIHIGELTRKCNDTRQIDDLVIGRNSSSLKESECSAGR